MRPRSAILIAAAVLFVTSHWIPFGRQLLYPLTLFTTWVHEMGHGLTALLAGGHFDHLEIYSNAGGLAFAYAERGWPMALVAAGGLLAPPLVGALILAIVHGPRRARTCLACSPRRSSCRCRVRADAGRRHRDDRGRARARRSRRGAPMPSIA